MTTTVTLNEVLNDLRANATGIRDKGTLFEDLVTGFLKSDPLHADRFIDVVPFREWAGEGFKKDLGIDLVAIEREGGGVVAIQCKFFEPGYSVQKADIDSFFTASGKHPFTSRLIVSTTDKWSPNAEVALQDQQIPVTRVGLQDMEESPVEWALLHNLEYPEAYRLAPKKVLKPHQRAAIDAVVAGFRASDRGKLIMACGTGKTFTALKLVEETVKPGGRVLFLMPSISLMSQSIREWGTERQVPMRFFAVCSDVGVGRTRKQKELNEDISAHDLEIPATTDPDKVVGHASGAAPGAITVVFSTYQSIEVIGAAQKKGLPEFDLIICDEAHRTTGVTLADDDESAFVMVHYNTNVAGKRRLYMTATPRVYGDEAKKKAGEGAAVLASMDDEVLFGPEFHRLKFGEAVDAGLLADYKVLVFNVAEDYVAQALQRALPHDGPEIDLSNAAKLVGCWNALAKRGDVADFGGDSRHMKRAVAFSQTIRASQEVKAALGELSGILTSAAADGTRLTVEADHVDGTQNALHRSNRLAWLKEEDVGEDVCRVLSNARCLSEGVDVPALDAVLFLNPRNSLVDVVQSVGRVMRTSPGKEFGYVVIPVAIPAGMEPDEALDKTDRYKVVWEVLRALRSHDERLDAVINTLDATKKSPRVSVLNIGTGGSGSDRNDQQPDATPAQVQGLLDFGDSPVWREAIFARLVKKVGQRMYWDQWAKDVDLIVKANVARINAILDDPHAPAVAEFEVFLTGLRGNLNDSITRDDAVNMLAQHLVTRPVFRALFEGYDFIQNNAVAVVMEAMLARLDEHKLEVENASLEKFYESVRLRLAEVDDKGRLRFVEELYGKFFKMAFPKVASQLGIVYTPAEIVDFIIRSVEYVLNEEFDASLSNKGVHVLDPFTGTGTFIVRLLQSGIIKPEDLLYKYTHELHCNEILLLAYYIASINIEATFHGIHGGEYVPFPGAILADTFQMTEAGDVLDTKVFTTNNDRMRDQIALDIRVIIGNPPYSVGQDSQNDNAANLRYPTLDAGIERTYDARSTASLTKSLYDSYIRAIRWASDRIGDQGVIGFVTNGGFLDSNSADGLRKTLADEFASIYVYNLRGNQRTAGEQSRQEGGKVFGAGSRATVAITLLVKHRDFEGAAAILYRDIGDYLTTEQKLAIVAGGELVSIPWERVEPNVAGDWINQRTVGFEAFTPIGSKDHGEHPVFRVFSGGLKTNRDAWVYNSSRLALEANVTRMVAFYNSQVDDFSAWCERGGLRDRKAAYIDFIDRDSTCISWDGTLEADLVRARRAVFEPGGVRASTYRPFSKQRVYFDRQLNNSVYRLPSIFPTPSLPNFGFAVSANGAAAPFTAFMTDAIPDLVVPGAGNPTQYFPRCTYQPIESSSPQGALDLSTDTTEVVDGYRRVDNITDEALADYRAAYGDAVTKDDIFHYVYGLLHSPDYRTAFAFDLKKMLPRIPQVPSVDDFHAFVTAGRELAALHVGYETVAPYALQITGEPGPEVVGDALYDWYRVEKMRYCGTGPAKDRSTVLYNPRITMTGIPAEAHDYMLGSRSAIDWILERYQVKVDKASQIKNDPNDWSREVGDPRYILDLLGRVVAVSVETVRIVGGLPHLEF